MLFLCIMEEGFGGYHILGIFFIVGDTIFHVFWFDERFIHQLLQYGGCIEALVQLTDVLS